MTNSEINTESPGTPETGTGMRIDAARLLNKTITGYSGDYKIIDLIGKGGMSDVYKARIESSKNENIISPIKSTNVGKTVACKVLLDRLLDNTKHYKRFQHEATLAKRLIHPNIINVYDAGEVDGQPFMILEYIEGSTLSDICEAQGKLSISRALPIFLQISNAFAYAHLNGIIHRDLKPSNIMLINNNERKDFVKVVDFGIAKIISETTVGATKLTKTGEVFGTPIYMSPEQCRGEALDVRSDIYSLGILMYEVLTGHPPFEGTDTWSTLFKQTTEMPESIGDIDSDVRLIKKIESIIFKCLEKDPASRYQKMEDLTNALESIMSFGNSGSIIWAKVSRGIRHAYRFLKHQLDSRLIGNSRSALIISSTLILIGVTIILSYFIWPVRNAFGTVPNQSDRLLELKPIPSLSNSKLEPVSKELFSIAHSFGASPGKLPAELLNIEDLELCMHKANNYLQAGQYDEAAKYYDAVETICLKNKMGDSDEIIEATTSHAECCLRTGSYGSAISFATYAIARLGARNDYYGARALSAFGKLAEAYDSDKQSKKALRAYKQFMERLSSSNINRCKRDLELTFNMSLAAEFLTEQKELEQAAPIFRASLDRWKRYSELYPNNVKIRYNLGVVENDYALLEILLSQYGPAHRLFEEALGNVAVFEGTQSPACAKIIFNDSDALWKLNNWYSALERRSIGRELWLKHYPESASS